jgi:transcriptional regulator with XRE-family HTH domain
MRKKVLPVLKLLVSQYINTNLADHNMTYKKLSAISQVPTTTIHAYAQGKTSNPNEENLIRIAAAFGDGPEVIHEMRRASLDSTVKENMLVAKSTDKEMVEEYASLIRANVAQILEEYRAQSAAQQTEILQHADRRVATVREETAKQCQLVAEQCRQHEQEYKQQCDALLAAERRAAAAEHAADTERVARLERTLFRYRIVSAVLLIVALLIAFAHSACADSGDVVLAQMSEAASDIWGDNVIAVRAGKYPTLSVREYDVTNTSLISRKFIINSSLSSLLRFIPEFSRIADENGYVYTDLRCNVFCQFFDATTMDYTDGLILALSLAPDSVRSFSDSSTFDDLLSLSYDFYAHPLMVDSSADEQLDATPAPQPTATPDKARSPLDTPGDTLRKLYAPYDLHAATTSPSAYKTTGVYLSGSVFYPQAYDGGTLVGLWLNGGEDLVYVNILDSCAPDRPIEVSDDLEIFGAAYGLTTSGQYPLVFATMQVINHGPDVLFK